MSELVKFFQNHPEISVSFIEKEVGIPAFHKILRGERKLPAKHRERLMKYLAAMEEELGKIEIK